MNHTLTEFFLEFNFPFAIAHGTRLGTDIVLLKISDNGFEGWGEASLPPYLAETITSVGSFIDSFFSKNKNKLNNLRESLTLLHEHAPSNFAAKACVDIALHNYFAAKEKVSVYQLLNLSNTHLPLCTFTIGMGTKKELEQKLKAAGEFQILKIKLGGENDCEIILNLREFTNKPICIDVNQGWKSKEHALEMLHWLIDKNVLFVEQPLPKANTSDQMWLFEKSPLKLFADESAQTAEDILAIKNCFHGVNVKLMKCGGISEAVRMITLARKFNLEVMLGSMTETGCGIKAASQISSLADYVDLDGPLLTKNNPFDIVKYELGKVVVS